MPFSDIQTQFSAESGFDCGLLSCMASLMSEMVIPLGSSVFTYDFIRSALDLRGIVTVFTSVHFGMSWGSEFGHCYSGLFFVRWRSIFDRSRRRRASSGFSGWLFRNRRRKWREVHGRDARNWLAGCWQFVTHPDLSRSSSCTFLALRNEHDAITGSNAQLSAATFDPPNLPVVGGGGRSKRDDKHSEPVRIGETLEKQKENRWCGCSFAVADQRRDLRAN